MSRDAQNVRAVTKVGTFLKLGSWDKHPAYCKDVCSKLAVVVVIKFLYDSVNSSSFRRKYHFKGINVVF